jgi:hypothetical protein
VPLLIVVLSWTFLKVHLIKKQYKKNDGDKVITIDSDKRQLTIKSPNKSDMIISLQDIKSIEFYESWSKSPPFSGLGYMKLSLINGHSLVITKSIIDWLDVISLTKGKPKKTITKLMPSLNWQTIANKSV